VATQAVPVARAARANGTRARFEEPPEPETWTAVYRRQGRGWFTEVEEVPGCSVQAPTLYQARDGILDALAAWLGTDVDGRDVIDEVELPPEVAHAVGSAAAARRTNEAGAELGRATSVLVDQFELDLQDAAALLSVPADELAAILGEQQDATQQWRPGAEDGDDLLSAWEEPSSAP
jgi:predicted RNase H-like HicB family nuclease